MRRPGQAAVFWVMALLTSALEPVGLASLPAAYPAVIIVMIVGTYGSNIVEAWLFWRRGLLAPLAFRLAYYLVWHVVGGQLGV